MGKIGEFLLRPIVKNSTLSLTFVFGYLWSVYALYNDVESKILVTIVFTLNLVLALLLILQVHMKSKKHNKNYKK